jgi:Domain of unknown function (DUF4349)
MRLRWKSLHEESPKWFKAAALAVAGVAALYVGALQPLQRAREIEQQRASGLAANGSMQSYQDDAFDHLTSSRNPEIVGGFIGAIPRSVRQDKSVQLASLAQSAAPPPPASTAPDDSDRKLVRSDSLDLVVKHPAETAEQIRQLATRLGGFLVTSEVSGDPHLPSASLTIRVPAAQFEQARAEIRKLGLHVESERVEAQDVTRQYVDQQAHLRNLRAEEQQYLLILKRANTVKDTLEVSDKLSEVRGEIEQQQAEFDALSKQVETVAITVSLRAEADTQVMGLHWRPLYRLKVAARDGLDGLGDYAGTMTAVGFYLPAILLWLATILTGAAIAWRILRWAARMIFATRKASPGGPSSAAPAPKASA